MDGVAQLITTAYIKDDIGQYVKDAETLRAVFVTEKSISRVEMFSAGQTGLSPEIMLETAAANYAGEKDIEYNNIRYSIYRTYRPYDSDIIELYLSKKAGDINA